VKLHRTLPATMLALVSLTAFAPAKVATEPATEVSAKVEVFATGLIYPRGLEFGPGGHLYVSEHGYGPGPTAGRILRINPR
jgi:glucose/arabinose dehydrogenase